MIWPSRINLIITVLGVFCAGGLAGTILSARSYAQGSGAILSFTPSSQSVKVGETLSTTILMNTNGEAINRVLVKVTYPNGTLTPQSIDQTGSFVQLWYQQNITTPGQIVLEGGVSGSGVSSTSDSQLTFVRINFSANSAGQANLVFDTQSAIYRESDGSNILTEAQSVTYTVTSLTPTPVPTFGGSSPTSTVAPTATTALTPGVSPTVGTGTPTPSGLPNGGTLSSTLIFLIAALVITSAGVLILRRT